MFIAELKLKNGETHIQIDSDFKKKSILSTISEFCLLPLYTIVNDICYEQYAIIHCSYDIDHIGGIFQWKKMAMGVIG